MKTWNQLFVRHGWRLMEERENVFSFVNETKENMQFLEECLEKADVEFECDGLSLFLEGEAISETEWIRILDYPERGRGGNLWFEPGKEEPIVRELDTYICGIVRQLNRLGFYTNGCCDGHGRRRPNISFTANGKCVTKLQVILEVLRMDDFHIREHRQGYSISLPMNQSQLLDIAEKLSLVEENWLDEGTEFIKEQFFYHLIEQLLSILGASGNEGRVREFVQETLAPFVDHISVDRSGNLLAEKKYRTGHGPTILLNAHLDLADELVPGRVLVKEDGIWSSSDGILGADDRAGVAVLLHTAQQLASSSFSGKVKFIFTVKEEIGLVGARNVDDYFLWGTDAAIVVDRRGKGDIVTSCRGYIPFCDEAYGRFFEKIAEEKDLTGWKCTEGGSSDTRIWAEHGIQSVNLSAGYQNEHTVDEYVDVKACYQTAKLVQSIFEHTRELREVLREIRRVRVS